MLITDQEEHFPPRLNTFFNREREIAKLLRYLDPLARPSGFIIHGVGGVGKSALAIEVAHRARERGYFDELIFMTARKAYWDFGQSDEQKSPRRGKYRFGSFPGLLGRLQWILDIQATDKEYDARLEIFKNELKLRKSRLLLVLDNLDALDATEVAKVDELVNFSLPEGNKAIITSRGILPSLEKIGLVEVKVEAFDKRTTYSFLNLLSPAWSIEMPLQGIPQLFSVSQGNPLILKQLVALSSVYGVGRTVQRLENIKHENMFSHLFESSIEGLSKNSMRVLVAIALATFPVTRSLLEYVTELLPEAIENAIDELWKWSLVISNEGRWDVHYLIEDYLLKDYLTARSSSEQTSWQHLEARVRSAELAF